MSLLIPQGDSAEDLSMLSIDALFELISSESLVISSEDSLLDLILCLGESYYSRLDCLRFEFLRLTGISRFCWFN
jgi:hypothetical protein